MPPPPPKDKGKQAPARTQTCITCLFNVHKRLQTLKHSIKVFNECLFFLYNLRRQFQVWKMFVSGWAVGSGFKSHPCYKFYSVPQMHLHVVTGVIMPYTAIFISMPWNSAFHPFIILESIHHSLCQLFREYLFQVTSCGQDKHGNHTRLRIHLLEKKKLWNEE